MVARTALWALSCALVVTLALTPLVMHAARRFGVLDEPRERGMAERPTPLWGGIALLGGVGVAASLFMVHSWRLIGILAGAAVIAAIGAWDDRVDLRVAPKLAGQVLAALVPVLAGVRVEDVEVPWLGTVVLGPVGGGILTVLGLVAMMNVINFSDGVDGLAAGVAAISAAAFAVIAYDLGRFQATILAAIIVGAALGFLVRNFPPASIFLGDCGANLLGLLLGCVAIEGAVKTNAVIALVIPLVVFAVPFLDTGFVVAKRLKYRRPVYRADAEHFHHRFGRIGFSQRRTVAYLYAWTLSLAALALALRFVPFHDDVGGGLRPGWTAVLLGFAVVALSASVYLVVVLEILKLRRLRAWQLRREAPGTDEHVIAAQVQRELETGEFDALDARRTGRRTAARAAGPGELDPVG